MSTERNGFFGRLREAVLSPERWRAAVTQNLSLKILSLAFAFGLWSFVNFGERDTEEALKVPLELRNIPASLVITSPRIDFIDLRVMGPRTLLGRIDRSRLSIPLDLNGVRAGPAVFRVAAESLNLPRGVRVVRINPAVVTLDLEKVGRKTIPVQLRLDGEPPEGFKLVSARLTPETVEVTGPASEVKEVESAYTRALDIADIEDGIIKQELALEPVGDYLSFDVPRVGVEVRIEEVVIRREVEGVSIGVRNSVDPAEIDPKTATVTLRGPQRLLSELEPDDVVPYVDATDGEGRAKVMLEVSPPLELVSVEPAEVSLTILHPTPSPADTPTDAAANEASSAKEEEAK